MEQIQELINSVLTVIVTIGLLIGSKKFVNLPIDNIGPELNILMYGFLWDIILKAARGQEYWPKITPALVSFKASILITLTIINITLMAGNLKLAHAIKAVPATDIRRKKQMKFWSYFIGVLSLMGFIYLQTVWS